MKPTYLYIKTHKITGLKYFGKTTKADPSKYKGSGIYWRKHLAKFGNEVITEVLGLFTNEHELTEYALKFSEENNISLSEEWANLKDENGLDGSPQGVKFSEEHKEKIRQSRLGKCYNDFDSNTRQKMSEAAKERVVKQIAAGKSAFCGEKGSQLAKERNAKWAREGKNPLQVKGMVSVTNKDGKDSRITQEEYKAQDGPVETWEYVSVTSKESKRRKGNGRI